MASHGLMELFDAGLNTNMTTAWKYGEIILYVENVKPRICEKVYNIRWSSALHLSSFIKVQGGGLHNHFTWWLLEMVSMTQHQWERVQPRIFFCHVCSVNMMNASQKEKKTKKSHVDVCCRKQVAYSCWFLFFLISSISFPR